MLRELGHGSLPTVLDVGGVIYLARFDFASDVAAPIGSPYTEVINGLTSTMTRSGAANATISGGALNMLVEGGTFSVAALARTQGRAAFSTSKRTSGVFIGGGGWENGYGTFDYRNGAFLGIGNVADVVRPISDNTLYQNVNIQRSVGSFSVFRGGAESEWTLWFVDSKRTGASVPSQFSSFNGAGNLYNLYLADLGAIWGDYAVATQRLAGARTAGDTFSHFADFSLEFVVQTLPSTSIVVKFRVVDANNYNTIEIDSTGVITIKMYVAGSPSTLSTSAVAIANGDTVLMQVYGNIVMVFECASLPYTRRVNIATASSNTAGNSGLLVDEGGGSVTDIIAWPYRINSTTAPDQLAALNRYAPSFP